MDIFYELKVTPVRNSRLANQKPTHRIVQFVANYSTRFVKCIRTVVDILKDLEFRTLNETEAFDFVIDLRAVDKVTSEQVTLPSSRIETVLQSSNDKFYANRFSLISADYYKPGLPIHVKIKRDDSQTSRTNDQLKVRLKWNGTLLDERTIESNERQVAEFVYRTSFDLFASTLPIVIQVSDTSVTNELTLHQWQSTNVARKMFAQLYDMGCRDGRQRLNLTISLPFDASKLDKKVLVKQFMPLQNKIRTILMTDLMKSQSSESCLTRDHRIINCPSQDYDDDEDLTDEAATKEKIIEIRYRSKKKLNSSLN